MKYLALLSIWLALPSCAALSTALSGKEVSAGYDKDSGFSVSVKVPASGK